jgi:Na+/H+-dicarboxylate symporter
MSRLFSYLILAGLLAGVGIGWAVNTYLSPEQAAPVIAGFKILTDIFLRLIKMIIAPLVFSTLVAGVAHMGAGSAMGRIGVKTIAWFIGASAVSLSLGALMVSLLRPGDGLNLTVAEGGAVETGVSAASLSLRDFIVHLVPRSFLEAMANNEILQIVVFSLFVGVALASLGEKVQGLVKLADQLVEVMLKITGYVMLVAPLAVFAAIAATVAQSGLSILLTYGKFMAGFYASLGVLWALLTLAGLLVIGPRMLRLLGMLRDPILLAFSTASSEAAFPKTLEQLRAFGVPRRIAGFVLPLGYSFNLDGSMMYCTFATLFVAQAYNITLTTGQVLTMLLLLMLTSKGMAGVPRASLVVIAATLAFFDIPEAGLLLILGIDQFLDMGRSATNVVGNAVASAVAAKWEGALLEGPADLDVQAQAPMQELGSAAPIKGA